MNGQQESRAGRSVRRQRVAAGASGIWDLRRTFAVCIALAALAAPAMAADIYWDGGNGTWNSTTNWSTDPTNDTPNPGSVPGATDTAHFNRSGNDNVAEIINLGATQSALGLVFTNQSASTLTGGAGDFGINLFSGGITVNSGAGAVTLGGAASPDLMAIVLNTSQTWTSNSLNPVSFINSIGSGDFELTLDGGSTAANTISGNISSSGQLDIKKEGTGTWTLSGSNNIGATFINNGKIILNRVGGGSVNGAVIGDSIGAPETALLEFAEDNQVLAAGLYTINSDGKVDMNGKNQTFGDGIVANGFKLDGGKLVNSGTGTITLGTNSGIYGNSGTNLITGGIINMGSAPRSFTANAAVVTVSSKLTQGSVVQSSGTLTLDGNNDYAGGTSFSGGLLNISSANALGTGTLTVSSVAGALDNTSGGTLSISNNLTLQAGLTFTGTDNLSFSTGNVIFDTGSGGVTVASKTLTFGGVVSSTGPGIGKAGTGTLVLSGNNTFSSALAVSLGTLEVPTFNNSGANGPLGTAATVTIGSSGFLGTLRYTGVTATSTKGITLFASATAGTASAVEVTESGTILTVTGIATGGNAAATFYKRGDGTLALGYTAGDNTFLSKVVVEDGTLLMNGSTTAGAQTATVTAKDTTTLGGTGRINRATVIESGATLAPGAAGTGSLEIGNGVTANRFLTMQADSTLAIELAGTSFDFGVTEQYDRLKLSSPTASVISGELDVSLISGFLLGASQLFGIVDTGTSLSGFFSNAAEGATLLTNNGYDLKITYLGAVTNSTVALTGGNDVVLYTVAIPEPTSLALIGCAAVGLVAVSRRRRRMSA